MANPGLSGNFDKSGKTGVQGAAIVLGAYGFVPYLFLKRLFPCLFNHFIKEKRHYRRHASASFAYS
ncbi:hypothetical protein M5W70_04570 [Paenibacillus larvae]|uniref:hypothetical protein n=1 Tax=Paenibacillus larvae TaxID=1464 RepID=UPI0001693633|nr:hypothetical protein [Paenibacillus larvae]AQR78063.1 hypothetical protein BXP28_12765 [Paenibacillus larvae subsp. larvae]MCY9688016.1 hypothetical protein [Paenibacillus larvae]